MISTAVTATDPHAPSLRHTLALAAAAAAGVAALGAAVALFDADEAWTIDTRIRSAVLAHDAPRTRAALRNASRLGTVAVYAPLTMLAMTLLARRRGRRHAMSPALAVGGSAALSFLLKQLIQRPRPEGENGPVNAHPSFPSGHTTRATALVAMLAYLAVRERVSSPAAAIPLAAAAATTVGIGRAYADAHWTTDVVGGWATGLTAMSIAALVYERLRADA